MINNLAIVHPDAQIGENVTIHPFAVIEKDTVIGDGSIIESHAMIKEGSRLGRECHIHPGAIISSVPQDLKFHGEKTTLELGDRVTIREYATLNRGTEANGATVIGSDSLVMAYCHVAHDCILGNNVILVNNVNLAGHVIIDDYAILGGLTAVQQFIHVGKHTYIAGGSKVRKNVPPYVRAAREPLAYIGINSVGLSRRGFSQDDIQDISKIYQFIYNSGLIRSKALDLVRAEINNPIKDEILDFIANSEGGIMAGNRRTAE